MAGLGLKNFASGDILTSAQVDGYLMQQSIMVFASTSARDSAFTAQSVTPADGMFAYVTDDDAIYRHDGTEWLPWFTQWTDYTPTWTNLTVGNAVQVAQYRYQGGDLRQRGKITWGTTTSASGVIYQDVANSETADSAGGSGVGAIRDDSSGAIYALTMDVAASDTALNFFTTTLIIDGGDAVSNDNISGQGAVTDVAPITLATSDVIRWDITVPVA